MPFKEKILWGMLSAMAMFYLVGNSVMWLNKNIPKWWKHVNRKRK